MLRLLAATSFLSVSMVFAQGWGVLAPNPGGSKRGDVILKSGFETVAERRPWGEAPFAKWVQNGAGGSTCLEITTGPGDKPGHHKLTLPIDLSPYKGMKILLTAKIKASGVTKAPQNYNGIKWMIHTKSPDNESYQNQGDLYGTFDWKEISFTQTIPPNLTSADLSLGLENCLGQAWFDDISITVVSGQKVVRPTPKADAPPPFKGHDLTRLRGAMLHPGTLGEEDYRAFGLEWKGNLARCQMTRSWGVAGTDLDLVEYDQWIEETCVGIDRMLNGALKYGYKVAIDLHSPPGGRFEDRSMRMFYEKKYQDHFVAVWERLAKRYKGHPAIWGYDLINEPVETKPAETGMGYLETQARAAKAIRAIDPVMPIIVEAAEWDSPAAYGYLEPIPESNIIYQVHMYEPGEFTHQGVYGGPAGVVYPGSIRGKEWNIESLKKVLTPVREFQKAYNVQIYVGEFSAIRWAQGADRYLADLTQIFEEYGWDWTYHAFREWQGWSVEHADTPVDKNNHPPAATTARKEALFSWFGKNLKPAYPDASKWMKTVPEKTKAAPKTETKAAAPLPTSVEVPPGVIFTESFDGPKRAKWTPEVFDLVDGPTGKSICILQPVAGASKTTLSPLPVESMKGRKVTVKARVRGENISIPPKAYLGPKMMLIITKADGKKDYPQAPLKTGTWDWQDASFTVDIPANAVKLELTLGLELSTGKIWFDDLRVEKVDSPGR